MQFISVDYCGECAGGACASRSRGCKYGVAGVDRRRARKKPVHGVERNMEPGNPVRDRDYASAWAGFLKGQLEYALDVVPVWVIVQPTNTAYGAGINPFAFKWIINGVKKSETVFRDWWRDGVH